MERATLRGLRGGRGGRVRRHPDLQELRREGIPERPDRPPRRRARPPSQSRTPRTEANAPASPEAAQPPVEKSSKRDSGPDRSRQGELGSPVLRAEALDAEGEAKEAPAREGPIRGARRPRVVAVLAVRPSSHGARGVNKPDRGPRLATAVRSATMPRRDPLSPLPLPARGNPPLPVGRPCGGRGGPRDRGAPPPGRHPPSAGQAPGLPDVGQGVPRGGQQAAPAGGVGRVPGPA